MALKGSANFGPRGSTALGFGGHAHRAFPGGEELAAVFYNGYDSPALHPLSFHVSSLTDDLARVHVAGI